MITIVGLPQAMAKVAAIPEVALVSGEAALTAGKIELTAAMRIVAPKRTGALAASIVPAPDGIAVLAPYAAFQEFGTVYMQAQPFVDPVMERGGPIVGKQVTETVRTALYAL